MLRWRCNDTHARMLNQLGRRSDRMPRIKRDHALACLQRRKVELDRLNTDSVQVADNVVFTPAPLVQQMGQPVRRRIQSLKSKRLIMMSRRNFVRANADLRRKSVQYFKQLTDPLLNDRRICAAIGTAGQVRNNDRRIQGSATVKTQPSSDSIDGRHRTIFLGFTRYDSVSRNEVTRFRTGHLVGMAINRQNWVPSSI